MRVALGTVQWGLNYGISNSNGIPSDDEIKLIINYAFESGISLIDTASAYGNAESRIGNFFKEKLNIVTKVASISYENSIENQISNSLKNLKINSIYGCLFHNVEELIKDPTLWNAIQNQKQSGKILKIGYSLYSPIQLEKLLELNYIPEIVQIPFNILDRRFEPYFGKLKELGVEIHIRSIFLQGLLLDFEIMNNSYFTQWNNIWENYSSWIKEGNFNCIEACLSHVQSYSEISKIVIGVTKKSELEAIVNASFKKSIKAPEFLISNDERLINPTFWNL